MGEDKIKNFLRGLQEFLWQKVYAVPLEERLGGVVARFKTNPILFFIKLPFKLPVYFVKALLYWPLSLFLDGAEEGMIEDTLVARLGSSIPREFEVGPLGLAVFLSGYCYHPHHKIKRLFMILGNSKQEIYNFNLSRYLMGAGLGRRDTAGFWVIANLPGTKKERILNISLRAVLTSGKTYTADLGPLRLLPLQEEERPNLPKDMKQRGLVTTCMATYNPPLDLFKRQIGSIKKQTYKDWICIINDDCSDEEVFGEMRKIIGRDPRFFVYRNTANLGFYRNFERCLKRVPEESTYVAFSDQDDFWHKDKFAILITALEEGGVLAYSDLRIVDRKGKVISDTFWIRRENNFRDLSNLLFTNTITGAASVFRRELLDKVLPFPQGLHGLYHDWWVACVALASGEIKYINQAPQDYYQHAEQVLGHSKIIERKEVSLKPFFYPTVSYYYEFTRLVAIAKTLLSRDTSAEKAPVLQLISGFEQFKLKLISQCLKTFIRRRRVTEAAPWRMMLSAIRCITFNRLAFLSTPALPKPKKQLVNAGFTSSQITGLEQKIALIRWDVRSKAKRRVNILIPTLDFKYFYGGYVVKFNFALALARRGYRVRIVVVDWCDFDPALWRKEIKHLRGLEDVFNKVEVAYAFDRSKPIEISPDDVFVATAWWTAHIANDAVRYTSKKRFLYVIQEYEPFTFPVGSLFALANQTYDFPHYAVISTEFLRSYFRENQIGVYKRGREPGDCDSVAFVNAILSFEVSKKKMHQRKKRKLLFYARPEGHAARNAFELGIMGLSKAIKEGCFDLDRWGFYGLGTVGKGERVGLTDGAYLTLLPRVSQDKYRKLLPQYDLGLSMILTPHPGLVHFEMAAAGMVVVTNTTEIRTKEALRKISENIIGAEPTVEGLAQALCAAQRCVWDYPQRIRGSHVNWSFDWRDTFNSKVIQKVEDFIDRDLD